MFIGDIVFQIIVFLVPLFFISIVIWIYIKSKKNRIQMQRLEAKIDKLNEKLNNKL